MPWLGHDRYRAELDAETARFAEAVADADPARPVPTCPEWTLAQLAAHVGWPRSPPCRRPTTSTPVRRPAGRRRDAPLPRTDTGLGPAGEWLVRRTPTVVAWEQGHDRAAVAVEVLGDGRLLAHSLEHGAFEG
jgi:hypothetical protein